MYLNLALFRKVLECDREDLFSVVNAIGHDCPMERLYGRALQAYFDGCKDDLLAIEIELRDLAIKFQQASQTENRDTAFHLSEIIKVRAAILGSYCAPAMVESLLKTCPCETLLAAETHFVAGLVFQTICNAMGMKEFNELAYAGFSAACAKKRAVKALHNATAARSRLDPNWNGRNDYYFLYRKAKAVGARSVAGAALYNLSLEQERMGAMIPALKSINRGIALLHRDFGTLTFLLALAHRIHLHLQLGRNADALAEMGVIESAAFPEVKAAGVFLRCMITGNMAPLSALPITQFTPAWRRKLTSGTTSEDSKRKLSKLENKLVRSLGAGPKNKTDLAIALFGDKLDLFVIENRFNNLLQRLKKKKPGLIYHQHGLYWLSGTHQSAKKVG